MHTYAPLAAPTTCIIYLVFYLVHPIWLEKYGSTAY
jgi:hypothetical protein